MKAIASLILLIFLSACSPTSDKPAGDTGLDAGFALIYNVSSRQQNVDKLLWIKDPGSDVTAWCERIASFNKGVTQQLEDWQESGQIVGLEHMNLPPVELRARERATNRTTGELIFSEDVSLRINLVTAQLKGLGYCADLCAVMSEEEQNQSMQTKLEQWQKQYSELYSDGMKILEGEPSAKRPDSTQSSKGNNNPSADSGGEEKINPPEAPRK